MYHSGKVYFAVAREHKAHVLLAETRDQTGWTCPCPVRLWGALCITQTLNPGSREHASPLPSPLSPPADLTRLRRFYSVCTRCLVDSLWCNLLLYWALFFCCGLSGFARLVFFSFFFGLFFSPKCFFYVCEFYHTPFCSWLEEEFWTKYLVCGQLTAELLNPVVALGEFSLNENKPKVAVWQTPRSIVHFMACIAKFEQVHNNFPWFYSSCLLFSDPSAGHIQGLKPYFKRRDVTLVSYGNSLYPASGSNPRTAVALLALPICVVAG